MVLGQVGEVEGGGEGGFVRVRKWILKWMCCGTGEPVEVLEDGGDVVTGAGMSEQTYDHFMKIISLDIINACRQ